MAATVDEKLLRATKFPPEFSQKVDMQKVNIEVMKKWIAGRISEILGDDDDVVIELCFNLLEGSRFPNIKHLQIQLTGFLEKATASFCQELWKLCLSAQSSPLGVPKELLEAKKMELRQEKAEAEKKAAEARRRREEETTRDKEVDNIRQRERNDRVHARGDRGDRERFGQARGGNYAPSPSSARMMDTYVPGGERRDDVRRRRSPPRSRSRSRSLTIRRRAYSPPRRSRSRERGGRARNEPRWRARSPSRSRSRSPKRSRYDRERKRDSHRRRRSRSRSKSSDNNRQKRSSSRDRRGREKSNDSDRHRAHSPNSKSQYRHHRERSISPKSSESSSSDSESARRIDSRRRPRNLPRRANDSSADESISGSRSASQPSHRDPEKDRERDGDSELKRRRSLERYEPRRKRRVEVSTHSDNDDPRNSLSSENQRYGPNGRRERDDLVSKSTGRERGRLTKDDYDDNNEEVGS